MAGQGDIDRPTAWQTGGTPLVPGSTTTPPAQGDLNTDGGNPDLFVGSFTLRIVTPTLGVAALPATTGQGQPEDAQTWNAVTPTLVTQATIAPGGLGEITDPNAFNAVTPTLGVGALPAVPKQGDIGDLYAPNEVFRGIMSAWAAGGPALTVGVITTPAGQGDFVDPWTWQDAVFYLTSQIYPVVVVETFKSSALVIRAPQVQNPADTFKSSFALVSGTLASSLKTYTNGAVEAIKSTGAFTGGTLVNGLRTYTNGAVEAIKSTGAFTGGTLVNGLITYTNWPTESIRSTAAFTGGTLA
jgi:hypothetical protein